MSNLFEYNNRLHQLDIRSFNEAILKDIESNNFKFDSNGKIKPLYGSTCLAWVEQKSDIFQKLCALQMIIQDKFEQVGVRDYFAFLEPRSYHMTICDIDASSDHTQVHSHGRIDRIQKTFEQIESVGKIHSQIKGIGLSTTISALVRFKSEKELIKVLDIEQKIKMAANTDVRNFTGHISLAYFIRYPKGKIQAIKDILLLYDNQLIGDFIFSEFDLTFFTDMNTYIPMLTINIMNRTAIRHEKNLKELSQFGVANNGNKI